MGMQKETYREELAFLITKEMEEIDLVAVSDGLPELYFLDTWC